MTSPCFKDGCRDGRADRKAGFIPRNRTSEMCSDEWYGYLQGYYEANNENIS